MNDLSELIPTINAIARYGQQPTLPESANVKDLERYLVKIYSLYFEISYEFDGIQYPDFDRESLPDLRENICRNFPDFGLYKTSIDPTNFDNLDDFGVGDAIDDLADIIKDLLEIKWRIENNSIADGLWYFENLFNGHTKEHVVDLLKYIGELEYKNNQ